MRNHTARVVLGACLTVASAAAQAPAPSYNRAAAGSADAGWQSVGSQQGGSSLGAGSLQALNVPSFGERLGAQDPDGEVDYTLTGLFRLHHGEFMDKRERYDPSVELRGRAYPNQRVGDEPGTFDLYGYDADIEVPVVISTEAYLLFGVYHYGRHYDTSGDFGTANNTTKWGDETLTATGVRLGFGVFFDENWLFEAETNPGIYSDIDGPLKHEDYDFPSSALFTARALDNLFIKFGARYNQVYRDAPWLPYLGFSWEVAEGFRFDLLLPEQLEFSYTPNAATIFALGATVQGAQYHVRSSAETGKQRDNLQVQEVLTYLGLTQRFTDSFSLATRVGAVVGGDYRLTTGAANFDLVEGALRPGFYADITMGIDW